MKALAQPEITNKLPTSAYPNHPRDWAEIKQLVPEENERLIAELEKLDASGRPLSPEQQRLAELLTTLIQQFESDTIRPAARPPRSPEGADGGWRLPPPD